MPRSAPFAELDRLAEAVVRHDEGVGIDRLLDQWGVRTPRRTLQRWLAALVSTGRLETLGAGRSLRYRSRGALAAASTGPVVAEPARPAYGPTLRVSAEGEEIRALVRRPRHERAPVAYDAAFLEAYHPNRTFYLPENLRAQLHVMGRSPAEGRPAGTLARDILNRLLIDLSWASSRLEGNTYSLLDTERLIRFGEVAEGKDALETQMILNHKAAIEYLVLDPAHAVLTPGALLGLHALLSDGLMADPMACGRLRRRVVEIGGSVFLPLGVPQRIEELFGITVDMAREIDDPFEQCFFLMAHLPYLQPFEDVNKRVSRLAANIPLIRRNLAPLSFLDVPVEAYVEGILGVYELRRIELLRDLFVRAYERSCQQYLAVRAQMAPPDPFRLRHRMALATVVRAIVQGGRNPSAAAIARLMPRDMAAQERERFIALVQGEFASLHADNAVRFGVTPLEYAAWQRRRK